MNQTFRRLAIVFAVMVGYAANAQFVNYMPFTTSIGGIGTNGNVGSVEGATGTSASGGVLYHVPSKVAPGSHAMVPSLSFDYNSQGGNGIMGQGWTLNGLSAITRSGKDYWHNEEVTPVGITNSDNFLLDGGLLIPQVGSNGGNGTDYGTEVQTYSKITSHGVVGSGPEWFQVWMKDGSVLEYGHTYDSRVQDKSGAQVMGWKINRRSDIYGNYIDYKYTSPNFISRIDEILYTGNSSIGMLPYNKIKFGYASNRLDLNSVAENGDWYSQPYLLTYVEVTDESSQFVRSYSIGYGHDNLNSYVQLITETCPNNAMFNGLWFRYNGLKTTPDPLKPITGIGAIAGTGSPEITGDFNGDGFTDIITRNAAISNGVVYTTKFTVNINDGTGGGYTPTYVREVNSGLQIVDKQNLPNGYNYHVNDFDGDGTDDILLIYRKSAVAPNTGDEIDKIELVRNLGGTAIVDTFYPPGGYKLIDRKNRCIVTGDFDGDGRTDFIIAAGNGTNYQAFMTCPGKAAASGYSSFVNEPIIFNPFDYTYNGLTVAAPAGFINDAPHANAIDFDGDGRHDLFLTRYMISSTNIDYHHVISFKRNSSSSNWTATEISEGAYPARNHLIYFGDFNGDRKTDILTRTSTNSTDWKIAMSDGKSFNPEDFTFTNQPNICTGSQNACYNTDDDVIVADLNGDGRTDIMHLRDNRWASTVTFDNYYSYKTNVTQNSFLKVTYGSSIHRIHGLAIPGDFNGDGKSDIFMDGISTTYAIQAFGAGAPDRLMATVRDGNGNFTNFNYNTLTNCKKSTKPFYSFSGLTAYPFNTIRVPVWTVDSVETPSGNGSLNYTSHTYADARFHKGGKGFAGFQGFTKNNLTTKFSSTTATSWDGTFFMPIQTIETKTGVLSGTAPTSIISKNQSDYTITQIGTGLPKRCKYELTSSRSDDLLKGTWTTTNMAYDADGNITTTDINAYNLEFESTQSSYEPASSTLTPVPALPSSVTVTKTRVGSGPETQTTNYVYQSGLLTSKQEFAGQPLQLQTSYSYDVAGNVITASALGSTAPPRTTYTTYDSKYRFATSTTNPAGQSDHTDYDPKFGNILNYTGIDGLQTSYGYDDFGRLVYSIAPNGFVETHSISFNVNSSLNTLYTTVEEIPGKQLTKTHFDALGRVKRIENAVWEATSAGATTPLFTIEDRTYDNKGNILNVTQPHFASEPAGVSGWLTTTYKYDGFNRSTGSCNSIGCSNISYLYYTDAVYGEVLKTTNTDLAGQQTSTIVDGTGRVCKHMDNGGGVSYQYDSWGNVKRSEPGGASAVISVYDTYNRLVIESDPNAGSTHYEYDEFGQLLKQTDALGNVHTITYDNLGNAITRVGPEGTIQYSYVPSGSAVNKIQQITGFNPGYSEKYSYDWYGQLIAKDEMIDGTMYTTNWSYDAYGRVASVQYPGSTPGAGPVIISDYNSYGRLINVIYNGVYLYRLTGINGRRQVVSGIRGNGLPAATTYAYGFPIRFYTPSVQDYKLTFDYTTGNVLSRLNNAAGTGLYETFTYDNLNRLTGASPGTTVPPASYMTQSVSYVTGATSSNGNISNKSDVGDYKYLGSKPHALTFSDNSASSIPFAVQDVTYSPFQKAMTVKEGTKELHLAYGSDYARRKSVLFDGSVLKETRIFTGPRSERISNTTTGVVHEVYYVPGPEGLAAVIDRMNNIETVYYPYSDHLGSIQTLTDQTGAIAYEQAFDAWGLRRNASDWTKTDGNVPPPPQWAWLRGFCGHEHLYDFQAINMNGRIYDPLVARMFSPDNYVQDGTFSQNYNRYSYCWNNPLRYTDPTGNFIWFVPIIYAAVNVGVDLAMNKGKMNLGEIALSAGMGALGGLTSGATSVGGAFLGAALSQAGRFMPSIPLYQSESFNLSVSPMVGFGSSGVNVGASVSASGKIGDWNYNVSASVGANSGVSSLGDAAGGSNFWNAGGMIAYTHKSTTYGVGLSYNRFYGGKTDQGIGAVHIKAGDFTLRVDEDYFGDGKDRYRTGGALATYQVNEDVTLAVGGSMMTGMNNGPPRAGGNPNSPGGLGQYDNCNEDLPNLRGGTLYGGMVYKGQAYFYGNNSEKRLHHVQNFIHNININIAFIHINLITPYFEDRMFRSKAYSYNGSYNPLYLFY